MEASRLEPRPAAGALADAREVLADYITLTKPKVQSLLILTTLRPAESC
jgi:heme O synthase-like polyprenyltransferase